MSSDALKVLRKAVGQPQSLVCLCSDGAGDCAADLASCTDNLGACGDARATCEEDLATCQEASACGDASVGEGEECDFGDLAGGSCVTLGFAGGKLACGSGCNFDTSGCYAARFVDNADGTITDHETGLMWEKKAARDAASNVANPHDADNAYVWAGTCSTNSSKYCQPGAAAAAACMANAEGSTKGCEECGDGEGTCTATQTIWTLVAELNNAGFAGHSNWRVPTLPEAQGIIDYRNDTLAVYEPFWTAPCFTNQCADATDPACSCPLISPGSWTASTYVLGSGKDAWAISEGGGDRAFAVRTSLFQVRLVRGS